MKELITTDPDIAMGKAVVTGTRITVEHILDALGSGETTDDLLAEHPRLTAEGIQAALKYAASVLRNDAFYPTGDSAA